MCLAVQTSQGRQVKRRKGKGKGKGKGRSKRTGRAFFGDEQAQDPEWRQEGDPVCGPKEDKKGSESNDGFQKGGFRHSRTKAEERIKKEKAKKEPILNPDSQPQKHPTKKDKARPGNKTIGLPVIGLVIPGLKMLGGSVQSLKLHGWWQPH